MTVFDRVKALCDRRKMSVVELEEKLGFSRNSLYSWKKNNPSSAKLEKVANYFDVSTDYLLGRTDTPSPSAESSSNEEQAKENFRNIFESYLEKKVPESKLAELLFMGYYATADWIDRENDHIRQIEFIKPYLSRAQEQGYSLLFFLEDVEKEYSGIAVAPYKTSQMKRTIALELLQKRYYESCEEMNLDPDTRPLEYVIFEGQRHLYITKNGIEQLRKKHNITFEIKDSHMTDDTITVTVRATANNEKNTETALFDEASGSSPIGENPTQARMKAESLAKRRAVISICFLGKYDNEAWYPLIENDIF